MSLKGRQYGLIQPKKASESAPTKLVKRPSAFQDDDSGSGSDEADALDWRKKQVGSGALKKQTKIEMARALAEDPTVYQYDEVYDAMEMRKAEEAAQLAQKKADPKNKQPRYIFNLLKQAEVRNREKERRIERQVQKEREAEGDEFADKEIFVTSSYREKMEQMQKQEEEERRQEAVEGLLDVTKQKDMSGFYRHIYRQTMGEEKGQQKPTTSDEPADKPKINLEKVRARSYRAIQPPDQDIGSASSAGEGEEDALDEGYGATGGGPKNEAEVEDGAKISGQDAAAAEERRKKELRLAKEKRDKRKRRIEKGEESSEDEGAQSDERHADTDSHRAKAAKKAGQHDGNDEPYNKLKRDIWLKVTVGKLYEDAVQRFFERKANRPSGFPFHTVPARS